MVDVPSDCVGKTPSHVETALLPMMNDHQGEDDDAAGKSRERRMTKPLAQPWLVGLIMTKGPHLMNGYWKHTTITASSSCHQNPLSIHCHCHGMIQTVGLSQMIWVHRIETTIYRFVATPVTQSEHKFFPTH